MEKYDKVGRAITFPVLLDNGSPVLATGNDVIKQSISDILGTDAPTFFYGEFKSRLNMLMFEQDDEVLVSLLRLFIFEALDTFEQRIKLLKIEFELNDEGGVLCNLFYRLIGDTKVNSFVYPFYRKLVH